MAKKDKLTINRQTKICLISLAMFPDRKDGSAKIASSIYKYFKENNYNIRAITAKWDIDLKDPNITQINVIKKRLFWFPQFILGVFSILLKEKFDIIHGNGARVSIAFLHRNFITTIHDLGPFEAKFTKIPIVPLLEKINALRAKRIITPSNTIKKGLKEHVPKLNSKKITCVYNPIDKNLKPDLEGGIKLKQKLGIKGSTILYLGRIAFYKGVEDLIKAYYIAKKDITDLNLVIAGAPTFKMKALYSNWKKKYTNIKFVGMVPEEEIQSYYSMADIFVTYSNVAEGFGLTPVESIACGTPVICSDLPAYREILGDFAILVPPKRPNALASEIVKFFKDEKIGKNLLKNSQNLVNKYSLDLFGKNLLRIYEEFLKF